MQRCDRVDLVTQDDDFLVDSLLRLGVLHLCKTYRSTCAANMIDCSIEQAPEEPTDHYRQLARTVLFLGPTFPEAIRRELEDDTPLRDRLADIAGTRPDPFTVLYKSAPGIPNGGLHHTAVVDGLIEWFTEYLLPMPDEQLLAVRQELFLHYHRRLKRGDRYAVYYIAALSRLGAQLRGAQDVVMLYPTPK